MASLSKNINGINSITVSNCCVACSTLSPLPNGTFKICNNTGGTLSFLAGSAIFPVQQLLSDCQCSALIMGLSGFTNYFMVGSSNYTIEVLTFTNGILTNTQTINGVNTYQAGNAEAHGICINIKICSVCP